MNNERPSNHLENSKISEPFISCRVCLFVFLFHFVLIPWNNLNMRMLTDIFLAQHCPFKEIILLLCSHSHNQLTPSWSYFLTYWHFQNIDLSFSFNPVLVIFLVAPYSYEWHIQHLGTDLIFLYYNDFSLYFNFDHSWYNLLIVPPVKSLFHTS